MKFPWVLKAGIRRFNLGKVKECTQVHIEHPNGTKEWRLRNNTVSSTGGYHREEGPALITPLENFWYLFSQLLIGDNLVLYKEELRQAKIQVSSTETEISWPIPENSVAHQGLS